MCILFLATSQKSTSVRSRRWVRKRDHDVIKHSTCRSRIECVSHCLADDHCNAFSLQSITAVSDIKKSLRQRQSWIITMYTESAVQRNMTSIACDVSSADAASGPVASGGTASADSAADEDMRELYVIKQ